MSTTMTPKGPQAQPTVRRSIPQIVLEPAADISLSFSYDTLGQEHSVDTPLITPASSTTVVSPSDRFTALSSPKKYPPPERVPLPKWAKHLIRQANERVGKRSLRHAERHWAWASILFVATIVGASIAVGWTLRLKSFRGNQVLDDNIPQYTSLWVGLFAHIVTVDSDDQSITMDWELEYHCPEEAASASEECPDVNVYFDLNFLRDDSSTTWNNAKPPPMFIVDAAAYRANNMSRYEQPDYRYNVPRFRTIVAMTNFFRTDGRSTQAYPFDKYSSTLTFWAESLQTNQSVTIGLIGTTGIAPGFNAQMEIDKSGVAAYGVKVKNFTVTRSQAIRIYAVLIVIAVWIVTMTFLLICVISVFLGKGIKTEVLVLPVTNLFAFTQLRSTMPGAPSGFGADIDFIGVLPCLVLLTFSSVFMCAVFLFRDPEEHARRWIQRHPEAAHFAHEKLRNATV